MSFKVLVIPEDPTYNGAILEPLVSRMLQECGKPNARVTILANPKADGFEHAKSILGEVMDRYAHFDLLLFLVDADGKDRTQLFRNIEAEANFRNVKLVCCAARQEVEVWLLAGHLNKVGKAWTEIRADVGVKENVFDAFLRKYGDSRRATGGRDLLMKETLANYAGLIQRCPELGELERRIREVLQPE